MASADLEKTQAIRNGLTKVLDGICVAERELVAAKAAREEAVGKVNRIENELRRFRLDLTKSLMATGDLDKFELGLVKGVEVGKG